MDCLVKEDGSVVTRGFCTSRWVIVRGEVGQVLLSPCGGSCVEFTNLLCCSPYAVLFVSLVRRFSGTVSREGSGLPPCRFWLQKLSWVNFARCVRQTGDLVVDFELAFSLDKLRHKVTVSVWVVSRRDFLCYSEAGPACVSHVLVRFHCLRVGSLSPLFIYSSDCIPGTGSRSPLCLFLACC